MPCHLWRPLIAALNLKVCFLSTVDAHLVGLWVESTILLACGEVLMPILLSLGWGL